MVKIRRVSGMEFVLLLLLSLAVSVGGYFLLAALDTPQLWVATFSIFTSFLASALTFLRSPYYALAYIANDVVLILLWGVACFTEPQYLSVVACFVTFLANDLFAFIKWRARERKQNI